MPRSTVRRMPLRSTTFVYAMLLLATTSSVSYGLARHIAWEGLLLGKSPSKIRGPIEMVAGTTTGTTRVSVDFKNDVAGAVRPWHVHIGSCAKGGPVFGGAAAYTPLKVSAAGIAEGTATLKVALPDSGSFYVNIHESATQMGNIVACGDLLLED